MIFILIFLVTYLFVGSLIARHQYAKDKYLRANADHTAEIARINASLGLMNHSRDCWVGPVHKSTSNNCDCAHRKEWGVLTSRKNLLIGEMGGEIYNGGPRYGTVVLWPFIGYNIWLTGGNYKPKGIDPALLARLEREAGIPELDSV